MTVVSIRNVTVVIFLIFISPLKTQIYDFSEGIENLNLEIPCKDGAVGIWNEEPASKYPEGPNLGLVLTSNDPTSGSCLETSDLIDITKESKLHIQLYINFKNNWEKTDVRVISESGSYFDWFTITGNDPQGWMEEAISLPADIEPGKYKVREIEFKNVIFRVKVFLFAIIIIIIANMQISNLYL